MNNIEMTTHPLPDRYWTFAILIYLCLLYTPLIISRSDTAESFLQGDSYYYRAVIDSILNDGDLLMENNVPLPLDGQLAIGTGGLVPKHPILMPLVSIPFYAAAGTPGLLLFNILDCMLLVVLIFKINGLFHERPIALITTLLYATTTLFLEYTFNYSPDIFSTVLVLGGLYLALSGQFYSGAGVLALSIFAKLTNAPLAVLTLIYMGLVLLRGETMDHNLVHSFKQNLPVLFTIAILFILLLIPMAYTNYLLFGSPVITGYQQTAVAGADGQVLSVDHSDKFNQPLLKGMYQSLFHARNGLIPTNPVLLLALPGVFLFRRMRSQGKVWLIALLCLTQFMFFAKYDEWFTSHFSNRFLMTLVALSSVFTANFISYVGQRLGWTRNLGR